MPTLLERIRSTLDVPRFCADCGRAIDVVEYGFDKATGSKGGKWLWRCPQIYVSISPREIYISGGGHVWGHGRPRWYIEGADDAD